MLHDWPSDLAFQKDVVSLQISPTLLFVGAKDRRIFPGWMRLVRVLFRLLPYEGQEVQYPSNFDGAAGQD
jgi:hypothetical protein